MTHKYNVGDKFIEEGYKGGDPFKIIYEIKEQKIIDYPIFLGIPPEKGYRVKVISSCNSIRKVGSCETMLENFVNVLKPYKTSFQKDIEKNYKV